MLRFPWRPGDCKLTFGPGNSLQLLGTSAKLLLIMRGEKGEKPAAVPETGPAARAEGRESRMSPTATMPRGPRALQAGETGTDRPPSDFSVTLLTVTFVILLFPSFDSKRGNSFRV